MRCQGRSRVRATRIFIAAGAWFGFAAAFSSAARAADGIEGGSPAATLILRDPALGADLVGRQLLVLRSTNGVFYQGVAIRASAALIAIDSGVVTEIPVAEVRTIWTVGPARLPIRKGDLVTIRSAEKLVRGKITALDEAALLVGEGPAGSRFKWWEILRIDVGDGAAAPVVAMPTATPVPDATPVAATPDAIETPSPEPSSTPSPSSLSSVIRAPRTHVREPKFGDAGTFELGGSFGFVSGSSKTEVGSSRTTSTGSDLLVRPFVGYFGMNGFEVFGEPRIRRTFTEYSGGQYERFTTVGLSIGLAYLFRAGPALRVGPRVTGGLHTRFGDYTDSAGGNISYNEGGSGMTLGVGAKTPIGGRAVLSVGAAYYFDRYNLIYSQAPAYQHGDGTDWGFETSIGLSIWLYRTPRFTRRYQPETEPGDPM